MASRALAIGTLLCAAACAASTSQPRVERGRITVGVTTAGSMAADLTFRLRSESAGIDTPIAADAGVFTSSSLPPGEHLVRLVDVPSRCRVDGGAERTITISQQQRSAVIRFNVACK